MIPILSVLLPRGNGRRELREEARPLVDGVLGVVEMIARNEKLEPVLAGIAALVEERAGGLRCAVMLLRNGRLYHAAGERLPRAFVAAVNGLPVGSDAQRPGAPFWDPSPRHSRMAADPRWAEFLGAALACGIESCWSFPLLSATGEVLGVLAAYAGPGRVLAAGEQELLASAGRLAAVSIEQRNLMDDLAHQAGHDPLTRLANRYLFDDRLQQAIYAAERTRQPVALLAIDLDRFGSVNDLLGHRVGDALLEQVARRLESSIRKSDTLARTGGDEFTLVLPALHAAEDARSVALKLRDALGDPFQVHGHELFVTASIGISVYPDDAGDTAALERNATDAMFRAKALGRNTVQAFTAEMNRANKERLEMETSLRKAMERRELYLVYQPQFDLRTGALAGVEALLRWENSSLGKVSPAAFVPLAEEAGLIGAIGNWVLGQACGQRALWGESLGAVRVAVNVSAMQFARADFAATVAAALEAAGIPAMWLELELTESVIMQDVEQAATKMGNLRELGISISMDDFGTGYSSLSYIQRLPFESVKIDQSFVREIRQAADRPPLVQSIIGMSHALGKRVVAEGVETEAQLRALIDMDCDVGQGFLLGRPAPPDKVALTPTAGLTASVPGLGSQLLGPGNHRLPERRLHPRLNTQDPTP